MAEHKSPWFFPYSQWENFPNEQNNWQSTVAHQQQRIREKVRKKMFSGENFPDFIFFSNLGERTSIYERKFCLTKIKSELAEKC